MLGAPTFWFATFLLLILLGLSLPLRVPLGPNYWDTDVYLDAIYRIRLGQVPSVDFFAPVGPLGYWLAAAIQSVFPNAHPMLLVNWAVLPVALPILALLVLEVGGYSRRKALALLLPALLFALLPVNLHSLNPAPGFDGYGHYNRHISLLVYLLVATLLFVRSRALRIGLVAALMVAMILLKITGAVAGALIIGYAALADRLHLRDAGLVAAIVLAALGLLDAMTGVVRPYLRDILVLLSINSSSLLPRFLTVASVKFNVVGPCLALISALTFAAWRDRSGPPTLANLRTVAASPLGWFAVVFAALFLFETQNTGSLEFIGLWPVLLLILAEWWRRSDAMRSLVLVLVLTATLPSLVIYVERSTRVLLSAPTYAKLDLPDLGPLGRTSLKRELADRAQVMLDHYATHQDSYRDLMKRGQVPSAILYMPSATIYSQPDDQATWLLETQQAVSAIRAWEADNHRHLESLYTLDFVDPLNWILGRTPPRHLPIGIDPSRTNPALAPDTLAALAATDAILVPKCPPTTDRAMIADDFAPALQGRRLIALAPCWDMYLRP